MSRPSKTQAFSLYAIRLWRMKNYLLLPIYPAVCEAMGFVPNTMVLVRIHRPYITFRALREYSDMPVETFTEKDLPPNITRKGRGPAEVTD